jgi:pilus assembly protein CpaB
MYTARIVVLIIALGAGGIAAYLVSGSENNKPALAIQAEPKLQTVDVLIAKSDIGLGQSVKPENLQWQSWPAETAGSTFIRRSDRPNAATEVVGEIARAPFISGEPIREQKLVKADGSGFMAAILPTGMRAVSTEITPETGAGGFILPNDRIDVILSRHEKNPDRQGVELVQSETVLTNIRVLAIDQAPKEKDGQTSVVGRTVTLELTPDQAETLARVRQSGTLSLALRSIADVNIVESKAETHGQRRSDSVNVVRYGVSSAATSQK